MQWHGWDFFLPFTKGIKRRIFLFKFNKFADVYVCALYIKHLVIRMTWLEQQIFYLYPSEKSVSHSMFLIKTNKREDRGDQLTCHVLGHVFPPAPCPWCCSIICFGVLILPESIIFFVVWKGSDGEKNPVFCCECLPVTSVCSGSVNVVSLNVVFRLTITYSFVRSNTTWSQKGKKKVRWRRMKWKTEKVMKN